MTKKENEHIYSLELTKKQAQLLSYACDMFSRIIAGQDWVYQEMMEEAWETRCKEATGKSMDKEWDGGWQEMRCDAEEISKQIKKRFWGLDARTMYGIHYNDTVDILFALHEVIRHQLWLDRPEEEKSHITVDASPAVQLGKEPLAIIKHINKK